MSKKLKYFWLAIVMTACVQNGQLTMPEDKMVNLLVDIHLAEASMQRLTNKIKDTLSLRYYNEIFTIHGINEEQYLENLKVLETNPKLAKKLYDEVLAKISTVENES